MEEQPASNESSGDEEDTVVVSLPRRGQEIDRTNRDHWVSAFERAVDIEVPKRGPNGRPKQIKKEFLKNYGIVIAFGLVFERLPKDKEVINTSSQNWSTFKEEFDSSLPFSKISMDL